MLERLPPVQRSSSGIHTQQAARLQELVEFIQSQVITSLLLPLLLILVSQSLNKNGSSLCLQQKKKGSNNSVSEASPRRDGSSIDNVLEDMQSRIKRLERWHTINTVLYRDHLVIMTNLYLTVFVYIMMKSKVARKYGWNLEQVLWTFLMSALVGYSLYQRKRQ